jgi:peptide-methionine (S)-S-oxide reductase
MTERATFAAGCFWGVEAAFRQIPGVLATRVGYTGGHKANPTYREVCSHRTGHAEAVEVTFDPEQVSYEELLDVFWRKHNPRSRNRQGLDVGSQYRSAIFFHSPEQEAAARASKDTLQAELRWPRKIVTQIEPADTFWEAEDYHQQYLEKRGRATCHTGLREAVRA